jgi:Asp-tRNA(Asn)/Glu-tRNA(Gln) amidotransferase A subunit family amidase
VRIFSRENAQIPNVYSIFGDQFFHSLLNKHGMKYLFLFICIGTITGALRAQNPVTKEVVAQAEKLIDLELNDAERDSLISQAQNYLLTYKAMHAQKIPNALAPALYFDPSPSKLNLAKKSSAKSVWNVPKRVELPKNKAELAFYSLPQLASLIQNRKISSVDLTRFFIERLKQYGDTLHCVISLTENIALAEAAKADAEIAKGQYRGVLHGIPYGVKDLFSVKNTRTTWGAAPFKNQQFEEDAAVVQHLRAAGAVLVAKLSMGSLAMGDVWYGGITRNPWDLAQGSSGSSAGSASAVAAGLLPFAIGTETQGSIVSPSTRNGTTGLRPTFGRVNRAGAMTLCWSLDKAGPITRSAYDAAIVFETINGGNTEGDKAAVDVPFAYPKDVDITKLRIGYPKSLFDSLKKDRNEWRTLEALEKLGAQLQPFEWKTSVPPRIMGVVLMSEAAAAFDELTRTNLDDELTSQNRFSWPNYFRAARFIPAVEYINANRLRTKMMAEIGDVLRGYDCVVMPSFEGDILPITNLTGHPIVVVPNGFLNNHPTSITFLGNLFDDAVILSVAKAFQDATDFDDVHPPMFQK